MVERLDSISPLSMLLEKPTRFLFFTGKGGVGKTSLACATAVGLADLGRRVLLVSTDPASNLGHVFGVTIGAQTSTPIPAVPNLDTLNIDPGAAARAYRNRLIDPVRAILPEKTVRHMEEQLSGACTTEIAAFDEFTGLLTDTRQTAAYDHIVFDTAPTGHTLRLLKLPSAWSSFLETSQSGASCLGPLAGLEKQQQLYRSAVDSLADASRTTLVLVSRPRRSALAEAARTSAELALLNVRNQLLMVNGIMPPVRGGDPLAVAMAERDRDAIEQMPQALTSLPTGHVYLQPRNLVGVESLRSLVRAADGGSVDAVPLPLQPAIDAPSLGGLVDEIAAGGHGLVMVMGKGGVGKTTIAAAVAVALAARGHEVHLTTTDPAAHVAAAVESELDHLAVSRIDPQVETERYRRQAMATLGRDLDEQSLALLEEDLRSPCTEEIAVFQAFSEVIQEAGHKFVVVDTAPTGHSLLLLDATGAYHRDIMRHAKEDDNVATPMMRLQDPNQTKILVVTLPETTPVLEAAALQDDLRRAGIEPWAWVVNASLAAAEPSDPLLVARARAEHAEIEKVQRDLAKRVALTSWHVEEPVGPRSLSRLVQAQPRAASGSRRR